MRADAIRRLATAALTALAACPSASTLTSARPLEAGTYEYGGAGGVLSDPSEFFGDAAALPHIEFLARVGLLDGVDMGFRLGTLGLGTDLKIALSRSENPNTGTDISIDPSFLWGGNTNNLSLPVLVGFNTGNGNQFVLGPRLGGRWGQHAARDEGGTAREPDNFTSLLLGASVGYYARAGSARFVPEVSAYLPLKTWWTERDGLSSTSASSVSGIAFQISLGLLFTDFQMLSYD